MLSQLVKKECNVSELAAPHDMSLAAISKHLNILTKAKFVQKTKHGRIARCRVNLKPLDPVLELLQELGLYWRNQLDALDEHLASENVAHNLKKESKHGRRGQTNSNSKSHRKKNNPR